MTKFLLTILLIMGSLSAFSADDEALTKGMVNPGFYEKPDWFKQSFLDLQEDLHDANGNKKRIILYFHQDGCPYCKKLLDDNFSRKDIVNKMKQHYELLAINMWGDKAVTLVTGEETTEKEFAKSMKVMFTPTLVALDNKGAPLFRMNGYYEPDKFSSVLDYLLLFSDTSVDNQKQPDFNEFYRQQLMAKGDAEQRQPSKKALPGLHTEMFITSENNLQELIENSQLPVMLLFEQQYCAECDELHGDVFRRLPIYKALKQFKIVQIDMNSSDLITAANGQSMTKKELAKSLNIQYTPSMIFYESGKPGNMHNPVFRSEAYLKSFHIQALLEYISTKSYLTEPEFQRFVQAKADKLHAEGIEFDLLD